MKNNISFLSKHLSKNNDTIAINFVFIKHDFTKFF